MLVRAKMQSTLRGIPVVVGDSGRLVWEEEEVCCDTWDKEANATGDRKAECGLISGGPKALALIQGRAAFLREARTTLPGQHLGYRRSPFPRVRVPSRRSCTRRHHQGPRARYLAKSNKNRPDKGTGFD
jgi:hypothetical protein